MNAPAWLTAALLTAALAAPALAQTPAPAAAGAAQAAAPAASPAPLAPSPDAGLPPMQTNDLLGPQDVINVEVLGRQDFKQTSRIAEDGTIQLPYLATVQAAGRSTRQLGDEVAKALAAGGYFTKPIVSVQVVAYASRNVTLLGSMGTPGVMALDRPYHLSEVVARAGGVRPEGADYILVRPLKGDQKRYVLRDLAVGNSDQDPFVAPGDKIFVPKAELFYISGQVKAPGTFALESGMTLRMAIARGGGVNDQGSEGRVRVNRGGRVVSVPLDAPIQPGDVIVVGERLF